MDRVQDSIFLGPLRVDLISFSATKRRLSSWMNVGDKPRLILTHNIAHFEQIRRYDELRAANTVAALATADGWPVARAAAKLSGRVVERVTGADLVEWLCAAPVTLALVGGRGDTANVAAKRIEELGVAKVVLVETVPPGELDDLETRAELIRRVADCGAQATLLGLGVPKQESLAMELMPQMSSGIVLCVGAAIEFIAGTDRRAPRFLQRAGLEWLHRLGRNPRKLFMRYAVAAPHFVRLVWKESRV